MIRPICILKTSQYRIVPTGTSALRLPAYLWFVSKSTMWGKTCSFHALFLWNLKSAQTFFNLVSQDVLFMAVAYHKIWSLCFVWLVVHVLLFYVLCLSLAINMKLISKTFEKLHTLCCGPWFCCASLWALECWSLHFLLLGTLRYSGFQILVLLCLLCRVCLLIYCTVS